MIYITGCLSDVCKFNSPKMMLLYVMFIAFLWPLWNSLSVLHRMSIEIAHIWQLWLYLIVQVLKCGRLVSVLVIHCSVGLPWQISNNIDCSSWYKSLTRTIEAMQGCVQRNFISLLKCISMYLLHYTSCQWLCVSCLFSTFGQIFFH